MRKVIIAAAIAVSAAGAASLYAAESQPCDAASRFCPLPQKMSAEREAMLFETKKAALKNMVSRQAAACSLAGEAGSGLTLSAKLAGGLFSLRDQVVLKAHETGLLLQLPGIVMEFMGSCGLKKDWNQLCGDYGNLLRKHGIPYRKGVLAAAQGS
uniref:hypothetical protein n=1 Tax=Candidatus Electronema sp. TaxID=2698783 RepID=UPI00405790B5